MYVTAILNDRVVLACEEEGLSAAETLKSVKDKLEKSYVDKVIPGEGLCVAVHQLSKVEPMPVLGPNDGRSCYRTAAKILLFRPLEREVLFGTVKAADAMGVRVTLGFFHDIRIPAHALPASAEFDEALSLWKWVVDSTNRKSDLYYELGALCRFRVLDVVYAKVETKEGAPMLVVGSMKDSGLGLDAWWT